MESKRMAMVAMSGVIPTRTMAGTREMKMAGVAAIVVETAIGATATTVTPKPLMVGAMTKVGIAGITMGAVEMEMEDGVGTMTRRTKAMVMQAVTILGEQMLVGEEEVVVVVVGRSSP